MRAARITRSRLAAAVGEPVDLQPLADDVADRHARIERGVRILENDLHLAAHLAQLALRASPADVLPVENHFAAGGLDRAAGSRGPTVDLAAARFADQAERLARADVEATRRRRLSRAPTVARTRPRATGKCLRGRGPRAGSCAAVVELDGIASLQSAASCRSLASIMRVAQRLASCRMAARRVPRRRRRAAAARSPRTGSHASRAARRESGNRPASERARHDAGNRVQPLPFAPPMLGQRISRPSV